MQVSFDVDSYMHSQHHTANSEINLCKTFKQFHQIFNGE